MHMRVIFNTLFLFFFLLVNISKNLRMDPTCISLSKEGRRSSFNHSKGYAGSHESLLYKSQAGQGLQGEGQMGNIK